MIKDIALVLVYKNKENWYVVYTVADTIERLAEISFRKREEVNKILFGELKSKGIREMIESYKPYALVFRDLTKKEMAFYTNQNNIETIVDEVSKSDSEINDRFNKWLNRYSFKKRRELDKSLYFIEVTGIKYGQLTEYNEKGIEDILRDRMRRLKELHAANNVDGENELRYYLSGIAFGTKLFGAVRDLIKTAHTSNFNENVVDLLIRRVLFINDGKIEDAACLLDEVIESIKRLKYSEHLSS